MREVSSEKTFKPSELVGQHNNEGGDNDAPFQGVGRNWLKPHCLKGLEKDEQRDGHE